jgi:hypothetical protein
VGDFVKNTEVDRKKKYFSFILSTEVDRKKYFSFILSVTTVFFLAAASANPLDGLPARWIALIHQIHTA